jgi:LysR family hydrogen peroxide-inducible transcriptional activator
MTLTELRYIIAVAQWRHFGRAANACFVSQPTLSVAVRKLEEKLNIVLFERGPGDVTITPVGQQVIAQAQRVLEEVEVISQIAVQGQDQLSGVLKLGVIYTIGPYLLPQLIPLLHQRAPQMPLQIEENYTAVLDDRLKQGQLDIIILSFPYEEPGVTTAALYKEPFVVVMPKGHHLEQSHAIQPHQLAQENLLLLGSGHCFRDQVLQACPECNQPGISSDNLQKSFAGSSLETIRLMVATGIGVTVLPQTSVNSHPYMADLLSTRPFVEPLPKRTVGLAWRKRFARPTAVQVLAEAVRACPLGDMVEIRETVQKTE